MILLALDFETDGLDRNQSRVIEVGAVLFSTNLNQTMSSHGYLVDHGIPISKEITDLTGIRKGMIDKFGVQQDFALKNLLVDIDACDAIVGHNIVDFDIPILKNWVAQEKEVLPERLAIDTMTDLPGVEVKKLGYMAADAGFVNPFPHRALADCLTVLKLVALHDGKHYPSTIDEIVNRAKSPRVYVAAKVSFDNNHLAKKRGYHWFPDRKVWFKVIKELDLESEAKQAPFDIARIEPVPLQ